MCQGIYYMHNLKPDDIDYCPLPLYHSAGGVLGVGQALWSGITIVIRRKFSASQFIVDCVKYKCTVRNVILQECVNVPAAWGMLHYIVSLLVLLCSIVMSALKSLHL